ncbi:hypothetical protein [Acidithiobacillus sulfurivorans]|uniref:Uncharacterized protein n=1 Tax=Acidithiobacillus sulfurivorans TaxID=1958756 RepID=A0ABS6A110_9PROT|nr:hypothetical protein [Acidithiobacillus sulfurivorans]MBU2760831.1 hypothetical protein [Acidithiobacillus sulfurivorans]
MNRISPECCEESQITNKTELQRCLEALKDVQGMEMEGLRIRQGYLETTHGIWGAMIHEDQELNALYNDTRLTIQRQINELRRSRTVE